MSVLRKLLVLTIGIVACIPSAVPEVEGPKAEAVKTPEAVKTAVEQPAQLENLATKRRTTPVVIGELPWHPQEARDRVQRADVLLQRGNGHQALLALGDDTMPQAALLRARALRMAGQTTGVEDSLLEADKDSALAKYTALERGLLAHDRGDSQAAVDALLPLLGSHHLSLARAAALPLTAALLASDPERLLGLGTRIEEALPVDDVDARSMWLEAQSMAASRLGKKEMAARFAMRRFIEEPVSLQTPDTPPAGSTPTGEQLLIRAEKLLEAHRNERVLTAVAEISDKDLTFELLCRKKFAAGLAARKLHHYTNADRHLGEVVASCKDEDLVRRAMYLQAKVVSIKKGLEAIPIINQFAERFVGHTMVDDVLFWGGDMYQRRERWKEATAFYRRIEQLPEKGDYCGEARWRMGWMAYQRGKTAQAIAALSRVLEDDGCVTHRFERARGHYWLARIYAATKMTQQAVSEYVRAIDSEPLGYYAQSALEHLQVLSPQRAASLIERLAPPTARKEPALCPGFLADDPSFFRAIELLTRGLNSDAAGELRTIEVPQQQEPAQSHAEPESTDSSPEPKVLTQLHAEPETTCPREQSLLLLSLLLDRAGAHRDAHWRLRTDFADTLAEYPSEENAAVWFAAYPLAFRPYIEAGEKESHLPHLFVQALAREESALDPQIVSWAGAYGLTQLLLESGQRAGKLLKPPVVVDRAEELLEPEVNARLGAALLGSQVRKLGGNLGLALAAYNAGDSVARTWWKRHQNQPFDVFAESITIKETRGYVMRVLTTFGIYRWLYANEPPLFPVDEKLPPWP